MDDAEVKKEAVIPGLDLIPAKPIELITGMLGCTVVHTVHKNQQKRRRDYFCSFIRASSSFQATNSLHMLKPFR